MVYATRGGNRVHVLDAATLTPLLAVDVGAGAHETAISPDGRWLVGSAYGGPGPGHQPADNRVFVVDLTSGAVHRTVTLEGMQRPNDIAFIPGTGKAVVSVEAPPRVVVLDVESGETRAITIEDKAGHMLSLSPDGGTAYVAHVVPGSMTVLDLVKGETRARVTLPLGAEGIATSRDGSRVWVASNRSGKVSLVDPAAGKVVRTVDCDGFPFRVRCGPDGKSVAITLPAKGEVAIFDAGDPDKVERTGLRVVGGGDGGGVAGEKFVPTALAFVPGTGELAVLCEGPKAEIAVVNMATRTVARRAAAAGPIPDGLTAGRVRVKKG